MKNEYITKIFVYGTLKSEKIQKELFGKKLKKYKAVLKDYSLYEASDGFYFIKPERNSKIDGYIIELDEKNLKICDAFEFCPNMYKRKKVYVECLNDKEECFIYYRVDDVGDFKKITNYNTYSRMTEEEFIKTEVKEFKEKIHPEFYN